ncbi:SGNH/GDSL hydrolase family protein [Bailinhaonella thermotolerans]|uniref:SGNH/GDSL hydrolase family protein n=1 Tax=Bailinhaonella thermotolerans TaxID=1070861 RepID=A0A3A4B6A5_9ACTN|nr:SGNH/GDSL hydrolase family protein [Bailinhaonella thermotolerans]RJL34097.1 SGNH/GDSL hydrolase family protein [Bailinhaonella thermotolerans]
MRSLARIAALLSGCVLLAAAPPVTAGAARTAPVPPAGGAGAAAGAPGAGPRPVAGVRAGRYVALGDSFTAGPLITLPPGENPGCLRSSLSYPVLVAHALRMPYTDASCSGAQTRHMTEAQIFPGPNKPQFDSLTRDTTLVTVGIGGNDIGFTEIVLTCGLLSPTDPKGDPCRRHYAPAGGGDRLARRIAVTSRRIDRVLHGIRVRSPHARILLVGYLRVLPPARGCYPDVPVAAGDVPYLDGIERRLNAMLAARAAANRVTFVDVYDPGHDVCAPASVRWVEGVFKAKGYPVHPNAAGMRATADRILAVLSR